MTTIKPYEVYWIDQDGHAVMSEEKNRNLVVGKVKMLLDLKLAHPGPEGIMIEIGVKRGLEKFVDEEAKA